MMDVLAPAMYFFFAVKALALALLALLLHYANKREEAPPPAPPVAAVPKEGPSGETGPRAPASRPSESEDFSPPRAVLEVEGRKARLLLPDGRVVPVPYGDYRALGEAGKYLTPGVHLVVRGLPDGQEVATALHLLEVMGVRVERA